MRTIAVCVLALLLAGCVAQDAAEMQKARIAQRRAESKLLEIPRPTYTPQIYEPTVYERKATFQQEEYAAYLARGTSMLSGEAFVVTPGGEVRYGSGVTIRLIPATAYGKEFLDLDLIREEPYTNPPLDERIYSAVRSTQADSKGHFSFSRIPAGNYFLYTAIYWEVPSRGPGSYSSRTGGRIWKSIAVANGEQATITLARSL